MFSEEKLKEAVKEVLINPTAKISPELTETCANLLGKTIKVITTCITEHANVHEKVCKEDATYLEFIHNVFSEGTYLKLTACGSLSESINRSNSFFFNASFLGLPFLGKTLFGINRFQIAKKYKEFINKAKIVMIVYNNAIRENIDFTLLFVSSLAFLNLCIEDYVNLLD